MVAELQEGLCPAGRRSSSSDKRREDVKTQGEDRPPPPGQQHIRILLQSQSASSSPLAISPIPFLQQSPADSLSLVLLWQVTHKRSA